MPRRGFSTSSEVHDNTAESFWTGLRNFPRPFSIPGYRCYPMLLNGLLSLLFRPLKITMLFLMCPCGDAMSGKTRILVVDDDAVTRRLLLAALSSDYQVVCACGAEEAVLQLASGGSFGLVISDLTKPSVSGIELIERARLQGIVVPFLVLSAMQTDQSVARAMQLGADDYLQKPIDLRDLRRSVSSLISRYAARAHPPAGASGAGDFVGSSYTSGLRRSTVRTIGDGTFVELTAPTDPMQAERFQRFAERLLTASLPEKERHNLRLALEEILRNAIEWGNKNDQTKQLRLSYCLLPDRITFRIEDEGQGFDHARLKDPSLDPQAHIRERRASGKRMGGWGVFLTRKVMDEVTYNPKGNIVFLTKFLRRSGSSTELPAASVPPPASDQSSALLASENSASL
jgi:DNA-binding response OmpR family regulator/anti-sigma regulatory factor (Ser/Thr protein kinase)